MCCSHAHNPLPGIVHCYSHSHVLQPCPQPLPVAVHCYSHVLRPFARVPRVTAAPSRCMRVCLQSIWGGLHPACTHMHVSATARMHCLTCSTASARRARTHTHTHTHTHSRMPAGAYEECYSLTCAVLESDPYCLYCLPLHLVAALHLGKKNELFMRCARRVSARSFQGRSIGACERGVQGWWWGAAAYAFHLTHDGVGLGGLFAAPAAVSARSFQGRSIGACVPDLQWK